MIIYVVFEIGCLECEKNSCVVSVHLDQAEADRARDEAEESREDNWGSFAYEVFPVEVPA